MAAIGYLVLLIVSQRVCPTSEAGKGMRWPEARGDGQWLRLSDIATRDKEKAR